MKKESYITEKLIEAAKPENLAKREKDLMNEIAKKGASAFNLESISRLCYGNEVVDLWEAKNNGN